MIVFDGADFPETIEEISCYRFLRAPQMEACSNCGGHGLHMSGEDVADCSACGGGGYIEARDARGRFLPWMIQ